MIVSFSGIDSAGKTTQIDLLYEYCQKNKVSVKKVWSKARGTPGVIFIKELVRKDKDMDAEGRSEYRKEVYSNPKKKKLLLVASLLDLLWFWGIYYRVLGLFYRVLICDRYIWDTLVELKSDFRGIDVENMFLWKLVTIVSPKPKHSFVFLIPAKVSIDRDIAKNAAGINSIEIKEEKINNYLKLKDRNKWNHIMDGMRSIEELHKEVISTLGV